MLILVPHVYILKLNRSAVLKCLLLTERVTAYKPAALMHILRIKGLDMIPYIKHKVHSSW